MTQPIPHRVGLYLALVQFLFTTTWTVYVIFLPKLAAQVGIGKEVVIFILMMDQVIFAFMDYAAGTMADKVSRVIGRLGRIMVAVTVISGLAFMLLPLVAPQGVAWLFIALTIVWSATSSALRAPPLVLLGKYAAKPAVPWLAALSLFGLGLAAAGALGLYLYQRRTPGMAATAGVGARVGAAVGSIGFALFALATAVQVAVFHSGSQLREEMMKAVEQTAVHNPDPQAQAAVAWLKTPDGLILMMALGLLVLLVVFVGCCSAGGALAATLMRNRSQGSSRQ